MDNKVVTLFGSSGSVERHLVKTLLENKFLVRFVTMDIRGVEKLKVLGKPGHLKIIEGDIRKNMNLIGQSISGSFIVINAFKSMENRDLNHFLHIHSKLPEEMAKQCKEHKIEKFIQLSDLSAETTQTIYARSRMLGEKTVLASFERSIVLKLSLVYDVDDDLISRLFSFAKKYSIFPIVSNCGVIIQPLFAGDLALIVLKICQKSEKYNGSYRVAGREMITMFDIYQSFEKILNKKIRKIKIGKNVLAVAIFLLNLKIMFPVNRVIFGNGRSPFNSEQMKTYCHNSVAKNENLLNTMNLIVEDFETRVRILEDVGKTPKI